MNTSWILAGVTLGFFLVAAGGAWLVARRTPRRRERRSIHRKMLFLLACGVVFAGYAFWTDSRQRQTTLHEVILEGAAAEAFVDGAAIHRVEFQIEHPGVEHELMINPKHRPPTWRRANFEVRIDATLAMVDSTLAEDEVEPLLSEQLTYAPRYQDTSWQAAHFSFTPSAASRHRLTLRLLTPDTPAVHVRIGDPLKTDGKRAPGY